MKNLIIYSSKTGNTKKIAEAIHDVNPDFTLLDVREVKEENLKNADFIIMGYWIDKGRPDRDAKDIIEKITNKKVGIFFTLGAYPDSDHAINMLNESIMLFDKNNNDVIETYLCQGKVDPELTKRFETLPKWHPHAMDDNRRARHKEAETHPDEKDLENAREKFKDFASR